MKKFLLMLLLAVAAHGQNVSYTVSTETFPNPERGIYRYSSSGSSGTTYSFISANTLNSYRAQNQTLILRMFYLQQFVASPISSTYLANMQTDFNNIRNAGLKVMIRFAYSNSASAPVLDATMAQTLAHIQQVAPVIAANRDVIASYQYGWIGAWGETYYTSQVADYGNEDYTSYTATQWANRKQILDAMINSTPAEIPVQVRYINYKQRFYPTGHNRVGFYNDSFLGTWGDSGTFSVSSSSSAPTTAESTYLTTQTDILPMTGETNMVNSPRTDCSNAVFEMNKYNWSSINRDYLPANITNWTTNGCYSEMEKRLGYRYELTSSSYANNVLTLNLTNSGYANAYKLRKAFIVLRNTTTGTEHSVEISADIRTWKKGLPTQLTANFQGAVPAGNYQLFLNIPDPILTTNPLYSIRCANTGVWDAVKGYNNLNQTVSVTGNLSTIEVPTAPVTISPPPVEILFVNNNTLVLYNLPSQNYAIKVFNLNGRLRAQSTDLSGLRRGYYIVRLECNGGVYTKNIYKQ